MESFVRYHQIVSAHLFLIINIAAVEEVVFSLLRGGEGERVLGKREM